MQYIMRLTDEIIYGSKIGLFCIIGGFLGGKITSLFFIMRGVTGGLEQ